MGETLVGWLGEILVGWENYWLVGWEKYWLGERGLTTVLERSRLSSGLFSSVAGAGASRSFGSLQSGRRSCGLELGVSRRQGGGSGGAPVRMVEDGGACSHQPANPPSCHHHHSSQHRHAAPGLAQSRSGNSVSSARQIADFCLNHHLLTPYLSSSL